MKTILRGASALLVLAVLTSPAAIATVVVGNDASSDRPGSRPGGNQLHQDLDLDLDQLAAWLEGRFDNDLQMREEGTPPDVVRLHSLFVPQDFPELGKHVFYVQQSLDDNPRKVHRQRFYLFDAEPAGEAIRLKVFVPSDPSALFDLHKEPQKRTGLQVSDLGHDPGCDVVLKRVKRGKKGDYFTGVTAPGACLEESSKYGRTLTIVKEVYIDEDEFWILEQARDNGGTLIYGPASGVAQKLRKANTYLCESAERNGQGAWEREGSFELHDQGARLRIDPERSGQLTAHLFRVVASGKNGQAKNGQAKNGKETLRLEIWEKGNDKPTGTATAEPGAATIAVETGALKFTCERQDGWIRQGTMDEAAGTKDEDAS